MGTWARGHVGTWANGKTSEKTGLVDTDTTVTKPAGHMACDLMALIVSSSCALVV